MYHQSLANQTALDKAASDKIKQDAIDQKEHLQEVQQNALNKFNGEESANARANFNNALAEFSAFNLGKESQSITITNNKTGTSSPIMIPSLNIGVNYSFHVTAINSFGESSPSVSVNLKPSGSGTITGDPHITTIYGKKYFLPNINGRFLLFNNKMQECNLYITTDCYFLTKEEIGEAPFVTKYLTDYTFMKTVNIKFRNQSLEINMNTLDVAHKNNNGIIINPIVSDKMVLSKFYSENKRKELDSALNFNGKSRKIELVYKDITYTITVAVDLGCADHRNDIKIEGPNMESGYGAIISSDHVVKIMNL
jgi:hypothetical protein